MPWVTTVVFQASSVSSLSASVWSRSPVAGVPASSVTAPVEVPVTTAASFVPVMVMVMVCVSVALPAPESSATWIV